MHAAELSIPPLIPINTRLSESIAFRVAAKCGKVKPNKMYSLIFVSSCILFRIYCKNSELLRSQMQSVHKNVYVENVKKRGVFGRLMGKRVSLKKYWEYKRLEYYLYSESAKFFLWWGNRQLSAYACYMDKRGLVVYPPKVLLNLE